MTPDQYKDRVESTSDQAWASLVSRLDELLPALKRIHAQTNPDDREMMLVLQAAYTAAGHACYLRETRSEP